VHALFPAPPPLACVGRRVASSEGRGGTASWGGGVERHTVLSRVCSLPLPPCACVPVCLCACLPPARWVRHHAVLPPPLSPGRYLALQASAGHTEGCYRRGWCQEPEDRGPLLPTAHVPLLWRGRLPQYVVMPSLSCAVAIMRSRHHAQSLSRAVVAACWLLHVPWCEAATLPRPRACVVVPPFASLDVPCVPCVPYLPLMA
jgi:hypothetical protein